MVYGLYASHPKECLTQALSPSLYQGVEPTGAQAGQRASTHRIEEGVGRMIGQRPFFMSSFARGLRRIGRADTMQTMRGERVAITAAGYPEGADSRCRIRLLNSSPHHFLIALAACRALGR